MYDDLVPPYSLWFRTGYGFYARFSTTQGKPIRKSLKTTDEKEAHRRAPGVIASALKAGPVALKFVVDTLTLVRRDYLIHGHRSIGKLDHAIARLTDRLGGYRLGHFSSADVLLYVESRQREGAANATINRELAVVRRGLNLAVRTAGLSRDLVPAIQALKENAPRSGFFERHQFEALLRHLRPEIKPVAEFAYEVGWRLREVLNLEWRQVDLNEGIVRLDPGTTKNGEGRVAYLSPALLDLLRAQKAATHDLERKHGRIIPWVFHRRGKRILRFLASWRTACKNAGVPGMLFHDLRRTAIRNMVRAGIPERVAMQISGHKTRSVFERYNIVSEADLRDAAERLALARARSHGASSGEVHRLPNARTSI